MSRPEPTLADESSEAIIARHAHFVERLARALVSESQGAADLAQEAWLAALGEPRVFHSAGLRNWLARVLKNRAASGRRRGRLRDHQALVDPYSSGSGSDLPDEIAARLERQELVQAALRGLEEPLRTTLVLRYQDGLSAAEIARRLGAPASSVRSRLARGLTLMREHLDGQHDGGRSEWLGALAPLAFPGRLEPALAGGALVPTALTIAMKKLQTATVALVLLVGGVMVSFLLWSGVHRPHVSHDDEKPLLVSDGGEIRSIEEQGVPVQDAAESRLSGVGGRAPKERAEITVLQKSRGSAPQPDVEDRASLAGPMPSISGRVTLLDGTPVPRLLLTATSLADETGASTNTGDDGTYVFVGLAAGGYRVSSTSTADIQGSTLAPVKVPALDADLILDAVLIQPLLPEGIGAESLEGGATVLASYRDPKGPFGLALTAGVGGEGRRLSRWIEPTGPGYRVVVNRANEPPLVGIVEPGCASGLYELTLAQDHPSLAAMEVTLTGTPLLAGERLSVGLDPLGSERGSWASGTISLKGAQRYGRTGVLTPGTYRLDPSVRGPLASTWTFASGATEPIEFLGGEIVSVDLVLARGGRLEVTPRAEGSQVQDTFRLEWIEPGTQEWRPYSVYFMTGVDEATSPSLLSTEVTYQGFRATPAGLQRFRLTGEGFETVEETLDLRPGEFTPWQPLMKDTR